MSSCADRGHLGDLSGYNVSRLLAPMLAFGGIDEMFKISDRHMPSTRMQKRSLPLIGNWMLARRCNPFENHVGCPVVLKEASYCYRLILAFTYSLLKKKDKF
jgi:hypothetical protein